ncbi:hypothetical protein K3495_g3436 [Podosphaera aphanis]|nr:hypothetical protein K3495_g3436 [Podosphaera aphanis]
MLPPVPNPEHYDICQKHGFLPSEPPLERLPDPYYNKWEAVVSNLQGLILTKRLRGVIDHLPILSTAGLKKRSEWRRAYSILSFMAHSYIWCGKSPSERLPPPISIPFLLVSTHLEVPPVATYAAVCLWNYKCLFEEEYIDNLDNLATLTTFTGSTDESWFYTVSIAIEARGAPTIPLMLKAIKAARVNDSRTVIQCLQTFAEILDDLGRLLEKMHDGCDPHVFYHRIRPYLAGSKNMADAGLPNGVIYDEGTGSEEYRQYSGGSNAQSSLIQFFDIALGIEHLPTRVRCRDVSSMIDPTKNMPPSQNFILNMREYMPGQHRRFLEDVSQVANIREYVNAHQDIGELTLAYDACLKMISDFRSTHIQIVSRYIILKSRDAGSQQLLKDSSTQGSKLDIASSSAQGRGEMVEKKSLKGTGGTTLIPFLKQARDETGESAVNAWARRIMSHGLDRKEGRWLLDSKIIHHTPAEYKMAGLAGPWTMDENSGGLCHY